jgi:signal transduction histidine kinase
VKTPFLKLAGLEGRSGTTLFALGLAALVPAVCVLWFMTVAMRNERLAVQDRLTGVYLTHLASLQSQLTVFWQGRQAALQATAKAPPAEWFSAVVRSNLADGVVVYDRSGKAIYPSSTTVEAPTAETGDWALARELDFQKSDYPAAAEAYGRISQASQDIHARARARQAQAGCLLKAGQRGDALARLEELATDPGLRNAISAQGTLIVPNVQLLILKLAAGAEAGRDDVDALRQQALDGLVKRLNDYSDSDFPSSQRRFLMGEVTTLAPQAAAFPTLAAEELAAEYLETNPALLTEPKLQRSPIARVWCLSSADRTTVALFRENRLKKDLATLVDLLALPDVRVTVLLPGETFASSTPVAPQEAGEFLPGWRLGLSFKESDFFATLSARQTRFYLWTGLLVVLIIALVAVLVARYVAAQMRLARLKNELLSAVSHELRTPLASIRALVDTLSAQRYRDEQQLKEYLQLIGKENLRLTHLIENFLTFSRMERGKQRFHFEDLAPADVVATAVEALQKRLAAAHCHFKVRVEPDLPRMRGDADALSTVLINLLDNACKYTGDDKRVCVRAFAENRHVCFEVEDNGIGLDGREARRIFDRFYQVDQSLTRQRGGCGLGLSIVKFIVEAHDGSVEVQSEPGKGSTFRVKIPLANGQPIPETEPPVAEPRSESRGEAKPL